MPVKGEAKPVQGRQSHLPLSRAFKISLNNLRIRFWRSIITAGGILLGIAFLTTVLTQWLMQWPIPEKINAGYVKLDGQIIRTGEYEVWKPIPVEKAIQVGIPQNVIDRVAPDKKDLHLSDVVQGMLDAQVSSKNLERAKSELKSLQSLKPALYSGANAEKDISVEDAVKAGVPQAIAKKLAGEGRTFKGAAIADVLKTHPDVVKTWERRSKYNAIYKGVSQKAIDELNKEYALTLGEVVKEAKGFDMKTADLNNIMITNATDKNRKFVVNYGKDKVKSDATPLVAGDNILVSDKNVYYRMIWLVIMSLLVSAVGITNSMLMSVTERFKEIGTMKCLGALDSFVVTLFMLEAGMLGICASVLGWLLGFVSIILVAGFTKGWVVVAGISPVGVLITFLISIGVGMLLTMIATIIPAQRAAVMPAAMALRSEI